VSERCVSGSEVIRGLFSVVVRRKHATGVGVELLVVLLFAEILLLHINLVNSVAVLFCVVLVASRRVLQDTVEKRRDEESKHVGPPELCGVWGWKQYYIVEDRVFWIGGYGEWRNEWRGEKARYGYYHSVAHSSASPEQCFHSLGGLQCCIINGSSQSIS
jgi:hypothetical protein